MSQIQRLDDGDGVRFAVEGRRDVLAGAVEDTYRRRLDAIAADAADADVRERAPAEALRSLLQLGSDWLDVEQGHLTRIDVADGTHTIAEVGGPTPTVVEGETRDLSTTFCRTVLAQNATLALRDAPTEGWADDPAYDEFGLRTYLGTKVVVEGALYGTLCFGGRAAREAPFDDSHAAAAVLLARTVGQLLEERPSGRSSSQPTPAQLETLFEHAPTMINIHDGEGTLIAPNPRLCEKTGYTSDELTGMKVWDLDREAQPEEVRALWADMDPGAHVRRTGTYQRKDGSTFPVEVALRRLDVEGQPRFIATSRDVTERREAERELQDTKRLLEATVESLSEAVLVVDPSAREIITCNAAVEDVFGYEKEELIGESTEVLHTSPEAYERFGAIGEPVLDEEGLFRHEYQMQRKDGTIIDTEHVVTPLQNDDWPEGVVSVIRDVTDEKRREQELEQMRDRIELALKNTESVIFEINLDTQEIWRHGAFEAYFDLPDSEVPTRDDYIARVVHPDDRKRLRAFYRQLETGEREKGTIEYRTSLDTGEVRWIRDSVYVENGDSRRAIGLAQNITERKRAEQELQEERDLLDRILETSPVAIAVFNTEGEFVEASGRAEEVLGLERDAVAGRTYDDPAWHIRAPDGGPMPEDDLPFARVMATEEPVYDVEHTIAWPDGTERLLSVSGAPLHAPDGALEGAVFHIDDITERRAARQALQDERDRFATLFHNLPTPVVHGRPGADGQLRVEAVNERFEAVFGYEEDDIHGDDLQRLIVPDEERDGAEAMRRRLLAGKPVNREVRRRAADGLRDFRVQVALRDGDRPTERFAIYTDVTDRKERERTLARRTALLEAQAEATLDGLLVLDDDRHVAFVNTRFREIWDLPADGPDEAPFDVPFEQGLLEMMATRHPDPEAFRKKVAYLHRHPDAESRDVVRLTDGTWLDQYSAPIVGEGDGHCGQLWVFRDVTAQRRMMERILEVQEEERRRIDREIHDEMGGLLTSLQFTIDLARRNARENDGSPEHFDQLEELVSELSTVSRTISRRLYPRALSERGLAEAVPDLVDELEREQGLDVDLYSEIDPGDRFSVPVERTVYWIVQETLMHIARRDEAEAVQVILDEREQQLYLHLFDGGTVPSRALGKGGGDRFEAIQRRVEWLDGQVRVDSIPDKGGRLSVVLPRQRPVAMR